MQIAVGLFGAALAGRGASDGAIRRLAKRARRSVESAVCTERAESRIISRGPIGRLFAQREY